MTVPPDARVRPVTGRRWLGVTGVALMLVGLALTDAPVHDAVAQSARSPGTAPSAPVSATADQLARALTVEGRPIRKSVRMVGVIEAGATTPVLAPFTGTLLEKRVEYGDPVAAGDLLAVLDATQLRIQYREAQAAVIKAQNRAQEVRVWASGQEALRARRDLRRAEQQDKIARQKATESASLYKLGLISRDEYRTELEQGTVARDTLQDAREQLKTILERGNDEALNLAQLELDNARFREQQLKTQVEGAGLRAPVAGVVLQPPAADPGQTPATPAPASPEVGGKVTEGQALFVIGRLDTLKVTAALPEIDINAISVGLPVRVTNEAFGPIALEGRVASVARQAVRDTRSTFPSFSTTVAIERVSDDARARVRLGMTAKLDILVRDLPNALVIPPSSIRETPNGYRVRRIDPDHQTIEEVVITLGDRLPEGVVITSGLSEGDRILP